MKHLRKLSVAGSVVALCALVAIADPSETLPNGRGIGTRQNQPHGDANGGGGNSGKPGSGNGITYHNGPLLTSGSHIYYIWYGNWGNNTAKTILPALASNIGGSPYFNINTTYYDSMNKHVQNSAVLAGQYVYPDSSLTTLADGDVQAIVAQTINGGQLSYDSAGVYFVLTSAEIHESSGFCSKYCGWHTSFPLNGDQTHRVKYAFVGNGDQCPSACQPQTVSPNNNAGADGMASVIAHELEEATTDPELTAWYDNRGYENADKCAWTFGTQKTASNGSKYNMTLGPLQFLIQQNWVNASGGYCALSY